MKVNTGSRIVTLKVLQPSFYREAFNMNIRVLSFILIVLYGKET